MTSLTPTDGGSPLFLPPTPSPSPSASPTLSTSDESPSPSPWEPTTGTPSWDQDDADAYVIDPGESSPTPSPDKAPARPKLAALRASFKQAVRTAGGIVNVVVPRAITHNPAETVHQVWVPDAEDEAAIAEPLARIASRRAPAAISDNPDLVDVAALALALVDYLRKSLTARATVPTETYVTGTVETDESGPGPDVADGSGTGLAGYDGPGYVAPGPYDGPAAGS